MARQHGSLTGQFAIKGRETDGKGLQGTHGETVIHGEDILCHTAKLHHYVIICKRHQRVSEGVEGGKTDSFLMVQPQFQKKLG